MAAPKATTTTAATDPDDALFDEWTPEQEDAALQRFNDVKHIIVEDDFIGRFPDGTKVRIPLNLSLEDVDGLGDTGDALEQFKHLIRQFAGDDAADQLNGQGMIRVAILAEKYQRALSRAQRLAFPES